MGKLEKFHKKLTMLGYNLTMEQIVNLLVNDKDNQGHAIRGCAYCEFKPNSALCASAHLSYCQKARLRGLNTSVTEDDLGNLVEALDKLGYFNLYNQVVAGYRPIKVVLEHRI